MAKPILVVRVLAESTSEMCKAVNAYVIKNCPDYNVVVVQDSSVKEVSFEIITEYNQQNSLAV